MKRLGIVVGVLAAVLVGALVAREAVADHSPPLVVVHWANSHPMREGLLPDMAEEFNDADHETASGQDIEIVVVSCDSAVQSKDLVQRLQGVPLEDGCGDASNATGGNPTIVTPQSSDWLVDINSDAGRDVVDVDGAEHIAETWLGIVTYREMAACLGWPQTEIGYQDIIDLAADPDGWGSHADCAMTEWGRPPLLAFTNPHTSTSGRNVLVSLYSIAANKPPGELTVNDIAQPEVVNFVKGFQDLVDHYMPTTTALITKIAQGERYGHFFLMPEDTLVNLYYGNEDYIGPDGTEQPVPPQTDLVMIYPKEGSTLNSNPAAVVDAPWVSDEQSAAAQEWIEFLREEDQQQRFMDAGFRPATGTGLTVDESQFQAWGLNAQVPEKIIEPGDLKPAVLDEIIDSWGKIKNPAIVTFVVDTSGSMEGEKIDEVKDGVSLVLDKMALSGDGGSGSKVGLVTFSDTVGTVIAPAPLDSETRYDISQTVYDATAAGGTALYDAVTRAIELTDQAAGDPGAKRSVVVLSDGEATEGGCLDELIEMASSSEVKVSSFCGQDGDSPTDDHGHPVAREDLVGESLRVETINKVQVFFVGFGDADIQIGRVLAQATGAEYQHSTNDALATVIEDLSGYF